jgi:hypothetical protein
LTKEIGLQDLLSQLKAELMQETPDSPRLFFIESAEIEVHVGIRREAQGGIRISVLQLGGVEAGASTGKERGHKITLRLVPLITYEEARKQLRGDDTKRVVEAVTKEPRW